MVYPKSIFIRRKFKNEILVKTNKNIRIARILLNFYKLRKYTFLPFLIKKKLLN
jgi:hypothetical protein